MLKCLNSDIRLRLVKQMAVSLPVKDSVLNSSHWTAVFVGRWEDDRITEEVIVDIRDTRMSNREIEL